MTQKTIVMQKRRTAINTFAISGVSCSAETFVVNQTLALSMNICAKNRHLRQAAFRCSQY